DLFGDGDVGRREAQFPAPAVALYDGAADLVGPAEDLGGAPHVAGGEALANEGGRVGDAAVVGADEAETQHVEAEVAAHPLEEADVAPAFVAEVEGRAHHHQPGPKAAAEYL